MEYGIRWHVAATGLEAGYAVRAYAGNRRVALSSPVLPLRTPTLVAREIVVQ